MIYCFVYANYMNLQVFSNFAFSKSRHNKSNRLWGIRGKRLL